MSASVNLPLHHKVQKFSSGTISPGWSRKKGRKTVWWWWYYFQFLASLWQSLQARLGSPKVNMLKKMKQLFYTLDAVPVTEQAVGKL